MKRIFAIAAVATAMVSCGDTTGYNDTTPAEKLVMHLEMLVDADKIMYGHQDDLMYGHSWKIEDGGGTDPHWDCFWCELNADINSAEVDHLITHDQAAYLRREYLRMGDSAGPSYT